MRKLPLLALVPILCFHHWASAQDSPLPPPPPMPAHNLDQTAPQVVYPSNPEIAEGMIRDLEQLQLTPAQAERIKQLYLQREAIQATPYVAPAHPITRTIAINLEPGVPPPVIRLSRGQQSSIVFSDVNGNPWAIRRVSLNRQLFTDGQSDASQDEHNNVLFLEPLGPMSYGNVSVLLNGLSTPVIFTLISGQDEVDVRVDSKVPGRNPDAHASVNVSTMPRIDADLPDFIDGTPPKAAKRLRVQGLDGTTAWSYQNNLYLRTHAAAQYPAYIAAARSTSGTSVYRFAEVHDTVTLLAGGRAVTIFIEQER